MSSIDFVNMEVVWSGENYLGLNDRWVSELLAKGYRLVDRRVLGKTRYKGPPKKPASAIARAINQEFARRVRERLSEDPAWKTFMETK